MRRVTLFLGVLLLAVTLTACGKEKETEPQTTEAPTQAITQKPTEAPTEKPTESSLDKTRELNVLITGVEGNNLQVQTVMGKALTLSADGAQVNVTDGLKKGIQVTVKYKGDIEGTDTSKIKISSIDAAASDAQQITEGTQTEKEAADPTVKGGQLSGTIKEITGERAIILADDGDSFYFTLNQCQLTLTNGIQAGNYVTVKYTGDVYGPDIIPAASIADTDSNQGSAKPETTEKTNSAEGIIKEASMSSLTITTDDGNELTFSISGVPVTLTKGFVTGQYIKVDFTGEMTGTDTSKIKVVSLSDASKTADVSSGTSTDEGTIDDSVTADDNSGDADSQNVDNSADNQSADDGSLDADGGTVNE